MSAEEIWFKTSEGDAERTKKLNFLMSAIADTQGAQGIKGEKGDKGDTGLQGIQGIQGVKGDDGIQGIQGVKGDTGNTGLQGIQGIAGAKGDKGDAGNSNLFIQSTEPVVGIGTEVLWIDTTGGNIQFKMVVGE